jgi:hypothetical protein
MLFSVVVFFFATITIAAGTAPSASIWQWFDWVVFGKTARVHPEAFPSAADVPNRFTGETQPPEPVAPFINPNLSPFWIGDYPENFPTDSDAVHEDCLVEGYIYESRYVFVPKPFDDTNDATPRPHITIMGTRKSNGQCLVIGTFTMMLGWSDIASRARELFPRHSIVKCGPNHRIDNRYCNKFQEPWLTWSAEPSAVVPAAAAAAEEKTFGEPSSSDK